MRKLFLSRVWAVFVLAAVTILYISGCSHSGVSPTDPGTHGMVSAQAVTGDPKLNLEVWNSGDTPNFSRIAGRITNWGSSSIALNRITVKAWFAGLGVGEAQTYVGQSWPSNQTVFNPGGGWLSNVAQTSVVIKPSTGLACGPNQVANWEVSINFTDSSNVQIPADGGYVETNAPPSALGAWSLNTWANFESPQDYSKISAAGTSSATRSNLQAYALYVDGVPVCEWISPTAKDPNTGLQPCGLSGCGVVPTVTPVVDPTSVPTVVADPTVTIAVDPTATVAVDPSATATATATATNTFTATNTPTVTRTFTVAATATSTATMTATATATSTGTPTASATPTATDPPVTKLELEYMTYQNGGTTNNPSVLFKVHNYGNTTVNTNQLEVRYWFSDAGWSNASFSTNVDWAGLMPLGTAITGGVSESIVPTSGHGAQDRYASFTFTGGTMVKPGQYVEVQARFNKTDWSTHSQADDFSFSTLGAYQYWHNMTMYLNGSLVWGPEP